MDLFSFGKIASYLSAYFFVTGSSLLLVLGIKYFYYSDQILLLPALNTFEAGHVDVQVAKAGAGTKKMNYQPHQQTTPLLQKVGLVENKQSLALPPV